MKIFVFFTLLIETTSINITCEFGDEIYNTWTKRYTCKTIKYFYDGHQKIVQSVSGNHHNLSYCNTNVTQFFAKSIKIQEFPEGLGSHFKFIEVIRMTACDMKILYKSNLRGLINLKYLDLVGNRLENLESNVFEYTVKLVEIWLNNNRLKFIGSQLLKPLHDLKVINLGGNTCISSNSRYSDEDLERLKIELRLKCGDISMYDLILKINRLNDKIDILLQNVENIEKDFLLYKKIISINAFAGNK